MKRFNLSICPTLIWRHKLPPDPGGVRVRLLLLRMEVRSFSFWSRKTPRLNDRNLLFSNLQALLQLLDLDVILLQARH
jgi:hypothetical protein